MHAVAFVVIIVTGNEARTRLTDLHLGASATSVASSGYFSNYSSRGSTDKPPRLFHDVSSKFSHFESHKMLLTQESIKTRKQ